MVEPAFEVGPDLSADIDPALTEREILAQISAVPVDHAFEQCKSIGALGGGIDRMVALVSKLWIACAHLLQRRAPDHEEAGSGVADLDEAGPLDDRARIVDFEDISQRGGGGIRPSGLADRPHPVPI